MSKVDYSLLEKGALLKDKWIITLPNISIKRWEVGYNKSQQLNN